MLRIGRIFDINIQMLKEWGQTVSKDLSKMCVSNISGLGDISQGINDTQEKLVRVLEQLRDEK